MVIVAPSTSSFESSRILTLFPFECEKNRLITECPVIMNMTGISSSYAHMFLPNNGDLPR